MNSLQGIFQPPSVGCPPKRVNSIWSATAGLGVAIGPLLGGVLAGSWGWRSVFLFNVPLVLVVAALVLRTVPETARIEDRGLDLLGQVAGIFALGSLTYALIEGGSNGASATVLAAFTAAAAAFVLVERRMERGGGDPMLPLGLFGSPTLSAGTLAGVALTFSVYGQLFLLSLYFGDVLGYSATATGLAFLPLAFVTFGASILSGRLTARMGLRLPLTAGLVLASAGSLLLLLAAEDAPYALLLPNLLLVGFGGGFILPPATAAVVSSAPSERAGITSAIVNSSRQVGGVLGVALLGALVAGGSDAAIVAGLHLAGLVCAGALLAGAAISLACVRAPRRAATETAP